MSVYDFRYPCPTAILVALLLLCSVVAAAYSTTPTIASIANGQQSFQSSGHNQQHHQAPPPSGRLELFMVRSPESTVAPPGDEVLFECELNLAPERLEWRYRTAFDARSDKNDFVYLNRNNGYNITLRDGISQLRIYVSPRTVGEYQCVAWFGASALASVTAKLMLATIAIATERKVYESMPATGRVSSLPQQIVHWRIAPGNSVIIRCGDIISNPAPVWNFYKNATPVPPTIQQLPSGALILNAVTARDTGSYSCAAVNSITGMDIKLPQRVALTVEKTPWLAPTFLTQPPSVFTVRLGASVVLECPAVGNPVPQAVWSRPDADIGVQKSNRTTKLGYGLQIVNASSADRGTYVCSVDNGIAPALAHQMRLDVLEAPAIVRGPRATLTNESDTLSLECVATGAPLPDIYWTINGEDTRWDVAATRDGARLVIRSVEKRHAGIVQCFARNDVGEVNESNLLQVNPKQIPGGVGGIPLGSVPQTPKMGVEHTGKTPKGRKKHKHPVMIPPSRPNVTRLSDESVMVRWSVPSNEGLPIQFFKVQYRMLGDQTRNIPRSQWMTSNEDIAPHVRSYEVDNLKPDQYYKFRIAAVYSNNDNKLGNISGKFHLQRGSQLNPSVSHLVAPALVRIEPISLNAVVLHWTFPANPPNPVDGFYAYYRPASTAGEYSKATVDGMASRHFRIEHLEPGTAYEFKLQSFTANAASDFSRILTGKTLKPSTPPPTITTVSNKENEVMTGSSSMLPILAGAAGGGLILVVGCIIGCLCLKRRQKAQRDEAGNESKAHPDYIQDGNGFQSGVVPGSVAPSAGGNGGRSVGSPIHKASRLNGVGPRMNIISNPLAQDPAGADKNRNVMELRFLPNHHHATMTTSTGSATTPSPAAGANHGNHHHHHHHHHHHANNNGPSPPRSLSPPGSPQPVHHNPYHQQQQPQQQQQHQQQQHHPPYNQHHATPPLPLDRSHRNLYTPADEESTGGGSVSTNGAVTRSASQRRMRRGSSSGTTVGIPPSSPRVVRAGLSTELLNNRSPLPARASKRAARLGSRVDHMSSGSLNSIEV